MGQIVGIDLGTTNSVVGVIEAGRPIVIANSEGSRTTPSIVGFTKDKEIVIGEQARRQLVLNPKNTFYNLKRFIGSDWDELDDTSISVPYNVKANNAGSVRVLSPNTEREYAPEELVSSLIVMTIYLRNLKRKGLSFHFLVEMAAVQVVQLK